MVRELHPVDVYVGNRLRQLRKKHNISMQTLADGLKVSNQQIQFYEQGANRISASALYEISQILHVPVDYFYEGYKNQVVQHKAEPSPIIKERPPQPLNILLVEDDAGDELLTRKALEMTEVPFNIHAVHDGIDALAVLRKQLVNPEFSTPDIVLLDINMPKKDGLTILKEIKHDREILDTPVIMLTNSIDVVQMRKCYKEHANGFIVKAYDIYKLKRDFIAMLDYWSAVILPTYE
jgi:CheY-like chemotaxis protein/DNA-binding XRE family transcriptional regulator